MPYLDDFEDDREPNYDHFVLLSAKQLRYLTNICTFLMMLGALVCGPLLVIITLQGTTTNETKATENSPCARLIPGARCVGFFSPAIGDNSIINFARQPENETLPICPLTMHCITSSPELLFFINLNTSTRNHSTNLTTINQVINTEAASRFVMSVPEHSILDAADYLPFLPFCRKQGGLIPKPFLWLVLQSVLSTVVVLAINAVMTSAWAQERVAGSVACAAMVAFRVKRCIRCMRRLLCCEICGDDADIQKNPMDEILLKQQSETTETSTSVFIEAKNAELADLLRKQKLSFSRRCFRMSNVTGVIAICTLVTGIINAIRTTIDTGTGSSNSNTSNATASAWTNFDTINDLDGWFGIFAMWSAALFNSSCLAGWVSVGTVLFVHVAAWAWDAFDAVMFVVMTEWCSQGTTGNIIGCCCFGICWWRLLCLLLGEFPKVACDYIFGCVAPLYSTLSYLLRGRMSDAGKDEYMPKCVLAYANLFLLVTALSWVVFFAPGAVLFMPILLINLKKDMAAHCNTVFSAHPKATGTSTALVRAAGDKMPVLT